MVLGWPDSSAPSRYLISSLDPLEHGCEHFEWCNPKSADDLAACRELLKAEFNGRWVPSPRGGQHKMALSSKGKRVLREMVNRITDWMGQQGIPIPNPELDKKRRDSGLMADAGSYKQWLTEQGIKSDGTPHHQSE
jgi:hypothetical protein